MKQIVLTWSALCLFLSPLRSEDVVGGKSFAVETIRDVAYYTGDDAHKTKHKLDLFLPKDCKDFPVIFFVHGGAWRHGDKNFLGIYTRLGNFWAAQGVGAVVTNYRLSPSVQHPEHIKDVARAFAWTHRNISKYRGDPESIFVCGHSAGGHLAALLVTNDKYLKAEGLDPKCIKGVMPMSGVYQIPEASAIFNQAFSKEATLRKDASPMLHLRSGLPPFLIVYAETDLPYCGKDTSEAFCSALVEQKCNAKAMEVKERNHMSLILYASKDDDPVARAFREFINQQCKK